MKNIQEYLDKNKDRFLSELFEWLKIPSISSEADYKEDMYRAANWAKEALLKAGADKAEVHETKGHPVVYGEKLVGDDKPTVLVYGHYDVQPVDPLDLWDSPPVEPVVKKTEIHPDGAIFARGACDDKGQVFMHIKALEAMVANNFLPVNMKF
ncbi:MAG TPA: M20/M25/M40 family metallo-hydrolase, partial [Saprospiraceae bacterium]|nr:M20/M25/M40 family metallo-hydrolase [Saprospiraceae bacterium]